MLAHSEQRGHVVFPWVVFSGGVNVAPSSAMCSCKLKHKEVLNDTKIEYRSNRVADRIDRIGYESR